MAEQLELLKKQIDREKERQELSLQECMQSILSEAEELVSYFNVCALVHVCVCTKMLC